MGSYVLGLDGGGSKTHCALFDTDGNKIDLLSWGPTNHEAFSRGYEQLREEMKKLFGTILERNNVGFEELSKCAFGLAGVDTKKQHAIISSILRDLGIGNFVLCNDAFLGVKAGCPNGVGICVINGTGFTFAGIGPDGRMLQVGGQGSYTGDRGGGGYLATAVIDTVYESMFKCKPATLMAEMLFEELKIPSKYDYMDFITESLQDGRLTQNRLCKMVFEAANKNDAVAVKILEDMGDEMARSVIGVIADLSFDGVEVLDVVLAGSVNVKGENPAATNRLRNELTAKNPDKKINLKILQKPPVAGAVVWALEGERRSEDIFDRVMEQL